MFHFAEGHNLFQRIGLALLLLQLPLFVYGLPPFHLGIWIQTEPDMVAIYSYGLCNALWLMYGVFRGALVRRPSPLLWYTLLAWVGWQVVVTFFATTPYRSWFGPVEMGEGVAWHLSMLLVAMLSFPLWQVRRFRHILMIWLAVILSVESVMHIVFSRRDSSYVPNLWIPAQWGAYMAFMVGYFWVLMMAGNYVRNLTIYIILIAFTMDVVIVSYNKTAIILMPIALGVSLFMFMRNRKRGGEAPPVSNAMRYGAMVACVLPAVWVVFSLMYVPPPTVAGEEHHLFSLAQKDSALGSRVGLIQVAGETMKHEPRRWLVGNGWGEFNDSMFRYALVPGVHVFENGERKPNWGFLDGNAYHSHCQPFEALTALGLPGMLLWFAVAFVIIWTLPSRLFWSCVPVLVALNAVSYLWFQLPNGVPLNGLMLAALCSVCSQHLPERKTSRRMWPVAGLGVVSVVMALTAMEQRGGMMYGERLFKGSRYLPVEQYPLRWLLSDMYRGADRLRVAAMGFALSLDKEHGDLDQRQHDWYGRFMDVGHEMMLSPSIGPRGRYLQLWLEYKLLLNLGYPLFADLGHRSVEEIRESVVTMAKVAPTRDDLSGFLLLNLDDVTHKDKALQITILREILDAAPNNRPSLWVLGHLLKDDPATAEEGEAMMRKAVAMHVQDVYAVTDDMLAPYR